MAYDAEGQHDEPAAGRPAREPRLVTAELARLDALSELSAVGDVREAIDVLRRHIPGDVDRLGVVRLDALPSGDVNAVTLGVWDRADLAPFGVNFDDLGLDIESRVPRIVVDADALDDESDAALKDTLERLRERSFAAFPLIHPRLETRLTGYLLLYRGVPYEYSETDTHLISALGSQLAIILEWMRAVEEIAHHNAQLEMMNTLLRNISEMTDLQDVGSEVAATVGRLLNYEHLSVALPDEPRETAALHVLSADGEEQAGSRVFPLDETAVNVVIEEGRTMLTPDLSKSAYKDHHAWWAEGAHGSMVAPLLVRGKVIGTFNVGFASGQKPQPDDIVALERLASQVGIVLDNVRLIEGLQSSLSEARTLYETAEAVNTSEDLSQLLESVVPRIADAGDTDIVRVYVAGPDPRSSVEYLDAVVTWHAADDTRPTYRPGDRATPDSVLPFEDYPFWRDNVVLNDLPEAAANALWETLSERGVRAFAMIPLVARDTWLGAVVLEKLKPQPFGEDAVTLCRRIADQAAVALDNHRLLIETRSAARRESVLQDISARLRQSQDSTAVLQIAVEELGKALGVQEASAYLGRLPDGGDGRPGERDVM